MKKLLLLILAVYAILFCTSYQFIFSFVINKIWQIVVPSFASLLGFEGQMSIAISGSGDTSFNFYQIALFSILAILFGLVLRFLIFKNKDEAKFIKVIVILIRYYLAAQMLNYGLAKLYYLQFQEPSMGRLEQTLGSMSPMGLLWTFMGYSKGYTMFTGFLEFVGGVLLLSKRTSMLGALVTFGVMLNVMMLNYCYDVPVKILSTHMVLMSFFLISLDTKRLMDFFVFNQNINAKQLTEIVPEKYIKSKHLFKWTVLIAYILFNANQMYELSNKYNDSSSKSPLEGAYEVDEFTVFSNGVELEKPLKEDTWSKLIVSKGYANIHFKNKNSSWKKMETDSVKNSFRLTSKLDSIGMIYDFNKVGDKVLVLSGHQFNDSIHVVLVKKSKMDHRLMSTGFKWVQESPFNR